METANAQKEMRLRKIMQGEDSPMMRKEAMVDQTDTIINLKTTLNSKNNQFNKWVKKFSSMISIFAKTSISSFSELKWKSTACETSSSASETSLVHRQQTFNILAIPYLTHSCLEISFLFYFFYTSNKLFLNKSARFFASDYF